MLARNEALIGFAEKWKIIFCLLTLLDADRLSQERPVDRADNFLLQWVENNCVIAKLAYSIKTTHYEDLSGFYCYHERVYAR